MSSENPRLLPTSFDAATSKKMPSRASATAVGIISTFDISASRDNPIGLWVQPVVVNVEERTCLYHPSISDRKEKEKEKVYSFRLRLKSCQIDITHYRQIHDVLL